MVCGQALANSFEAHYRDVRTTRMLLNELYQNETLQCSSWNTRMLKDDLHQVETRARHINCLRNTCSTSSVG